MPKQSDSSGLGERLGRLLRDRDITQGDLADRLGKSQAAVSQWVSGAKMPGRQTVQALAQELDVEVTWLLDGSGTEPETDLSPQRDLYRQEGGWRFRPQAADGGRDFGNANIWSLDPTLDTFVREVLQNSVDARRGDRVEVTFRLIHLSGAPLDEYLKALKFEDELYPHLQASTENQQKFGRTLRAGLRGLDRGELLLCVIEDRGAAGLVGDEFGSGNFAALTRNNLDSSKKDTAAGGSYGLGKAALWRMSSLATVLFCSDLLEATEQGDRSLRIIGRSELAWHQLGDSDSDSFSGPGWFGRVDPDDERRTISFWENRALARDLYLDRPGGEPGTSICVLGFHDPTAEETPSPRELAEHIEASAARWFWPAIAGGELMVSVETRGTHGEFTSQVDAEEHQAAFFDALLKHETDELRERLLEEGDVVRVPVPLEIPERTADEDPHSATTHDATLLIRRAADDDQSSEVNSLALFRGVGMVVRYLDLSRVCTGARPFHAALLCGRAAADSMDAAVAEQFLRAAEPPAHDVWELTPELKRDYKKGSGAAMRRFLELARDEIRQLVRPSTEDLSDGPQNLKELFRVTSEPDPNERGPRVARDTTATIDEQGRWAVDGSLTLRPDDRAWRVMPVVVFDAETGGGRVVPWDGELDPVSGCKLAEDGRLAIDRGVRSVKFRGVTDASRHPVPAGNATITIDVRKVESLSED